MSKLKTRVENNVPDVAGALQTIRTKKSREQIKAERLMPFVPVIDEALAVGWKWSPIVMLIRESGGPSLTNADARALYAQIKSKGGPDDGTDVNDDMSRNASASAPRTGPKKEEAA